MVGKAKSLARRRIENAQIKEELVIEAVYRYRNQASYTADSAPPKRKSLKTIAQEVARDHPIASRRKLAPSVSTISRRLQGKRSRKEAAAKQCHLTRAEENIIVEYALELASRHIPFSHRRLREHINEVIHARDPHFTGVGKNFTQRFIDRHHNELSTCWSYTADAHRGGAVNETTNTAWFDLLERTITTNNIDNKNIYGMDETGLQGGEGYGERVITAVGTSGQGQKRSGGRETNTVMATICGDRSRLSPTVIFKGKHYLVEWKQDNPLKASIARSLKGWVTGEIAVEWIKDFDNQTAAKAGGQPRLLLLDGHASHLTRAFLEFAYQRRIIILCYPSHTTHVYQGLDVVCFGPFKRAWSAHRDAYEMETGQPINKSNFLRILGDAYVEALTPANIREAFRKTGVIPLDRSVISAKLLAPARETSVKGSLPLRQPSPIQEVVGVLTNALTNENSGSVDSNLATTMRTALTSTSVAYLANPGDIPVEHESLPLPTHIKVEPLSAETQSVFNFVPRTKNETQLLSALHEFAERDQQHTEAAKAATATAVLQGVYCKRLKQQLFGKKNSNQKAQGRLGNGLPAMLTDPAFIKEVGDRETQRNRTQEIKQARKEARLEYRAAMEEWKRAERERIDQNKADAEMYRIQLANWEVERDIAKQEHRRPGWKKPVKPARRLPGPKPVMRVVETASESGSSDEDSDDGYESVESVDE